MKYTKLTHKKELTVAEYFMNMALGFSALSALCIILPKLI